MTTIKNKAQDKQAIEAYRDDFPIASVLLAVLSLLILSSCCLATLIALNS